ncbi:MAG: hypothetical protein KAG89_09750 [Fulvimarina manganoxydans]|uniref:condensation domain-containing protein n=1 Tax=Fulvimarina manganoxydans TaxID=937218 RepID=UPI002357EB9B|nr:condensation domain-containing protein [Fulvimarina manganoxydans]MCK5932436.1 hypothetical protein [Fulvimarina manganoxydans]
MTNPSLPETFTKLSPGLRDAVLRKLVERRKRLDSGHSLRLRAADRSRPVPASLEQQAFLDLQERYSGRLAWTIAAPPILLDDVDPSRVRQAVEQLQRVHDVLHATFHPGRHGWEMALDPNRPAPFAITKIPFTAALAGAEAFVRRRYDALLAEPFTPETGPLWRAELAMRGRKGVLLLTFCSLLVDGDALYGLKQRLEALLAPEAGSRAMPEAHRFDYADYAATQHALLREGAFDSALETCESLLDGGPPAHWRDGRAPIGPSHLHEQHLCEETGRALDAYAAGHHTTPPVVLLTEYLNTLKALDGGDDLWVSLASAPRDLPGTETMIGTFARQTLFRLAWSETADMLPNVHARMATSLDAAPLPQTLVRAMLERTYPNAASAYRYVFNHRVVGTEPAEDKPAHDIVYRAGPKRGDGEREEDILFMVLQSGRTRTLHWYLRADRFAPAQAEDLLRLFHTRLMRRIMA